MSYVLSGITGGAATLTKKILSSKQMKVLVLTQLGKVKNVWMYELPTNKEKKLLEMVFLNVQDKLF